MPTVLAHIAGVPVEEALAVAAIAGAAWLPFVRAKLGGAARMRRRSG